MKEHHIYCLKRLNLETQIEIEFPLVKKDRELINDFQKVLFSSEWTDLDDKRDYAGYYTILMPIDADCECLKIDI